AEDGIRDSSVTGVQTCALPIYLVMLDHRPSSELSSATFHHHLWNGLLRSSVSGVMVAGQVVLDNGVLVTVDEREVAARARECAEIGRASCRERVDKSVGGVGGE